MSDKDLLDGIPSQLKDIFGLKDSKVSKCEHWWIITPNGFKCKNCNINLDRKNRATK